MAYGSGRFTYEMVPGWAKLPAGWKWAASCGVAVDADDNVYVLTRTEHPVIVFDRQGNFLRSFGEGMFSRAHGAFITPEQHVYCTDDLDHVIRKYTLDGTLIETMGVKGQASDSGYIHEGPLMQRLGSIKRGAGPFNRPTKLVVAPWGERYVTDGYGNARVHRFSADGQLISSWGEPGHGSGEFFLPHGLAVDARERVVVADRENSRVQIFSRSGEFLTQWTDLDKASDVAVDSDGLLYISELPGRVCIKDLDGNVLARLSAEEGPIQWRAHDLCVDSRGDIYMGEIYAEGTTIHKFARVS